MLKNGLSTFFQPIISAADGRLFAQEALLRGPTGSHLESPLEMFSAARGAGTTLELDRLALALAIERFASGHFRGKLFVNLLPETLVEFGGFPDWLAETLRRHRLSADRLVIEITEHGEQLDAGPVRDTAARLRGMGCEIAIDDFGTGLSGLKIWSELRPDYVKIDRYFISRLAEDTIAVEVLRAMLDMAHVLGTRVIAEGIEDEQQLQLLCSIGVDYLQGYYISKPLPEAAALTGKFTTLSRPEVSVSGVACVADLCVPRAPLPASARISEAVALFQANPDWDSLPVVDEGRPVGILCRDRLLLTLSKPLHPEIYNPKSVTRLMDPGVLVIDERARLSQASRLITRNPRSRINEDFVVVRDGKYRGVGRSIELLHHITEQQLHEAQQSNPLTLLPGNREIDAQILRLMTLRAPFAVCHADIDNFKPFNDEYGYRHGDQVLLHLAGLCRSAAAQGQDFVGHPGGDDFILIMRSHDWQRRVTRIVESFSASCARFYSDAHRVAGGFIGKGRDGQQREFPLMTLSVGAVSVDPNRYSGSAELMGVLSAAKQRAKGREGNSMILNDGEDDRTMRMRMITAAG